MAVVQRSIGVGDGVGCVGVSVVGLERVDGDEVVRLRRRDGTPLTLRWSKLLREEES